MPFSVRCFLTVAVDQFRWGDSRFCYIERIERRCFNSSFLAEEWAQETDAGHQSLAREQPKVKIGAIRGVEHALISGNFLQFVSSLWLFCRMSMYLLGTETRKKSVELTARLSCAILVSE